MKKDLPLISIIVPVYNVEQYLHDCADSILMQTYDNLEIILINDGSVDASPQICDEYALSDKRIKVIHKENGGLSEARNSGINAMTGKYLSFVDSDDIIAPDMIEFLYNDLLEYNADISCCKIKKIHQKSDIANNNMPAEKKPVLLTNEQAVMRRLSGGKISASACAKLYKKHIYDDIRFPAGKLWEDSRVIIDVLMTAKHICVDSAPKYYYRQRKDSTVGSYDLLTRLELRLESHEDGYNAILTRYPQFTLPGEAFICKKYIGSINSLLFDCKIKTDKYNYVLTLIINKIRKISKAIKKNPHINKQDKMLLFILGTRILPCKLRLFMYRKMRTIFQRIDRTNKKEIPSF